MKIVQNDFNKIYCCLMDKVYNDFDYSILNRKGEKVFELLDYSFTLTKPKKCFATCRDMSIDYLKGELEFYTSGSPFLKEISKHSKFWNKVSDDGRTIFSNYGKLLLHDRNHHNYTQFEYAREMLLQNKDSKKAVMTIYNRENAHPSNDNPCTMFLQFFIRGGKLHLFVKMRSSDIWYGLPYDVPFFCLIQLKMLKELRSNYDIKLGNYNHQTGSLHMYERNLLLIKEKLSKVYNLIGISEFKRSEFEKGCDDYLLELYSQTLFKHIGYIGGEYE